MASNNDPSVKKDIGSDLYNDVSGDNLSFANQMVKKLKAAENHSLLEQAYDELGERYDKMMEAVQYEAHNHTAKAISQVEPNHHAKILDVGCGSGLVGKRLYNDGYRNIHGVDLSSNLLKILGKKGIYSHLVHANFGPSYPLEYKDGFFDVVMSCGAFLPSHLTHTCVPEMTRLLKPGGYLVITCRKKIFEEEMGDMKLKAALSDLTKAGKLVKISHEDASYLREEQEDIAGIILTYQAPENV